MHMAQSLERMHDALQAEKMSHWRPTAGVRTTFKFRKAFKLLRHCQWHEHIEHKLYKVSMDAGQSSSESPR